MGETKRIVTEHFPVDKLPEELRRGIESGKVVRVTVESGAQPSAERRPLTSYIGVGKGVYSSPEDAIEKIGALRDEWK